MDDKKIAIVTGASRGIGLSITKRLLSLGYRVIGCCRNTERCDFSDPNFVLHTVDLTFAKQIETWISEIKKENRLDILIHNAGSGFFAPMEELSWSQIQEMVSLNLTAPMLITNSLLRMLKNTEGRLIFIGSISGIQVSPWGSVYGATKAGMLHLGRELFQELRKSGVKVTNIIPDIVDTNFYEDLSFGIDEDPKSHLLSECISAAVENILTQREGTNISEIVIQPERFKIKKK